MKKTVFSNLFSVSQFDIGSGTLAQHIKRQKNWKTKFENKAFFEIKTALTLSNSICSCIVQILTLDFKPEKYEFQSGTIYYRNVPLLFNDAPLKYHLLLMSICRMSVQFLFQSMSILNIFPNLKIPTPETIFKQVIILILS